MIYLLYYLSGDAIRGVGSNFHAAMGLVFPFLLVVHIVRGRRHQVANRSRVQTAVKQSDRRSI